MRDASLPERAWDTVETWTQNSYAFTDVASALRKLERPIPGRGGTHLTGLFQEANPYQTDSFLQIDNQDTGDSYEDTPIYM